jgi:hypothetical protein
VAWLGDHGTGTTTIVARPLAAGTPAEEAHAPTLVEMRLIDSSVWP